jgi:hypothetical protein
MVLEFSCGMVELSSAWHDALAVSGYAEMPKFLVRC